VEGPGCTWVKEPDEDDVLWLAIMDLVVPWRYRI